MVVVKLKRRAVVKKKKVSTPRKRRTMVKVRRDTLKNVNNIRINIPAGSAAAGGGSASGGGGGGAGSTVILPASYPGSSGVADNTTGNEFKALRRDVQATFDSLYGDLANSRELDRQFRQSVGVVISQPTRPTVATREAGIQHDVVVPMDANQARAQPNLPDPMDVQGPIDPVQPVQPVILPTNVTPLVNRAPARADLMDVADQRETERQQQAADNRQFVNEAVAPMRGFGPPAAGLQGNGDPRQGFDGIGIGNTRLPKRRADPDATPPRGFGNELVVAADATPAAQARAAAEAGYIERIANRDQYPLYRGLAVDGNVALPIYDNTLVNNRSRPARRLNEQGAVEQAEPPAQGLLQLQYEDDGL